MDSTSIDEDLVKEREERMVSYSENNSQPVIKKAYFLKPCVTSIEGMLRPAPCPELKASSLSVCFRGWRLPNKKFQFWAKKMAALHKPTWLKSGIFEAIKASTYRIHKNPSLILSLAQNWCPETNTFVFPWGEATITLEDVNVLLGFSVLGSSVFAPLRSSEMKEAVEKLEKREKSVKQDTWISSFVDDEMEHEAFLVLWLSKFVFPDKSGCLILSNVFPIAVRLARGERIALAPAVLANLYNDLSQICALASTQNVNPGSLFKLVQVWIWERFKSIRPQAKVIPRGKPRIAQWSGLKQRFGNVGLILFDGNFDWRPYTEPLENWNPPQFYLEDAKWVRIDESFDGDDDDVYVSFARYVRVSKLVGIGLVENYYPNRVAMQFGLAQDLPVLVTNHSRNSTEQEAWDDYNRSLDGLRLYIPSRLATASVTARYRDWWTKSVSKMRKESTETFNVSSTVDHYADSDDEIALKVVPLSQVFQKLDGKMKKAKHSTNKRRKQACEDDESADTEDDDNMTIAQRIKSRKKCSDHLENTEGERSRLEVDNNVSDLPQRLAYGDETAAQETEQKNDEKNSSNPSDGVAKKDEDVIDAERLKQRNLATIAQRIKSRKKRVDIENTEGERSRLEVDNSVPQKLNETVATKETEQKSESVIKNPSKPSNGAAENQEDDDERLKQRKLAIEELALKMEARILKVENTLAKIKQWKLGRTHTKTPVSA